MIWKPKKILEFNEGWGERVFNEYSEWMAFLNSQFKVPGEYSLRDTHLWTERAAFFLEHKRYTHDHPKSNEYKDFWLTERRKCKDGIIVRGQYVPPDIYFFINYCSIYDKVKGIFTFPEVWDSHLHYALYLELAWYSNLNTVSVKARQKGISLFHCARMVKRLWFEKGAKLKILGYEESYVQDEWKICEHYRDHLNEHTGWYRNFSPNENLNWVQRREQIEGSVDKRKVTKGNKSSLSGASTKQNLTRAVGGAALEIYVTEAGVNPQLKKIMEYGLPNIRMGSVQTGMFCIAGAVGELKNAEDIKSMVMNPNAYNIYPVKNIFKTIQYDDSGYTYDKKETDVIGFFHPSYWNYYYQDEKTMQVVRCYDKDGNSDIGLALKYLSIEETNAKKKDLKSYKLWKSQNPITIEDAFDERDDNIFPTDTLRRHEKYLIANDPGIVVDLVRDEKGKVRHRFSSAKPIESIRPDPDDDNTGAVVIYDFPIDNPPFGLYYAAVDPIRNIDTSTSKSLMSISVFIGWHERDGKVHSPYQVATYTGRFKSPEKTYERVLDIIEFYNARTAVENNVTDFIEWMIRKGKSRYLLRRRELYVISEMVPNSSIRDEIGIRMEGEFKSRCLEKVINYLDETISVYFNMETGESEEIKGVSRIKDKMLIKEMISFTPRLNTDRLICLMLNLVTVDSFANRQIVVEVKSGFKKEEPKKTMPSQFSGRNIGKMPSQFMRKYR